jgi:TATA-box binding protein (TBP) (component of TFIID and TFIIIB)
MSKINWDKVKFIDYLNVEENEINNLPNGVSVSTMCASCKLGTNINILNIEKYLQLSYDDILCVKKNSGRIRTLIQEKKKKQDQEKIINSKSFYNQITVLIRINTGPCIAEEWEKEPKINLKLFKNGSIQMSGCKSLKSINIVLNKLLIKLSEIKAKYDKETESITEILFVEDIVLLNIASFKIDMINSNYKVNLQIDRDKFYNLLLKKKIKSSFEPCIRACIIVKHVPLIDNDDQKEISIFIFQKGNIIITGARKKTHILSSYNYINNILIKHSGEISKKDEKEEEDLILNLYNNIMKEKANLNNLNLKNLNLA